MKLNILTFGIAKDITGNQTFEMHLPEGATTGDLKTALNQQFPDFEKLTSLAIAVNNTYTRDNLILNESDEIALIPPVSGG
ncbi:MoaD/ThiS family protein [Saprospiraceae bacterium]|jgi:molybdopterin synthase sulfur carrier subunit|nr:MoaD/ThiS family protein [Bacteroidota bacterium]MDB4727363.1 MoaD/ThiS family protein [Saprospiraceae bacterium]MDF1863732.1 MoaD/ThiS family protein [Saprospiraceae bacterium]